VYQKKTALAVVLVIPGVVDAKRQRIRTEPQGADNCIFTLKMETKNGKS